MLYILLHSSIESLLCCKTALDFILFCLYIYCNCGVNKNVSGMWPCRKSIYNDSSECKNKNTKFHGELEKKPIICVRMG